MRRLLIVMMTVTCGAGAAVSPAHAQAQGHAHAPTAGAATAPSGAKDAAQIKQWVAAYDAAFNAKDVDKLAAFYHEAVTIYEGGGINKGWADYRDHHLGPELKMFEQLRFSTSDVTVNALGADPNVAYVTAAYTLTAKAKDRDIESGGLVTWVLVKSTDGGSWRIRHSHTSSKRRPAPASKPAQ